MRRARVCYDHLAGELGVLVYDRLAQHGAFALGAGGMSLTPDGAALVARIGVATGAPPGSRRPFCRACLDWSERRDHLAGALGAALLDRFEQLAWVRRVPASRELTVSATGEAALHDWLALADYCRVIGKARVRLSKKYRLSGMRHMSYDRGIGHNCTHHGYFHLSAPVPASERQRPCHMRRRLGAVALPAAALAGLWPRGALRG